MTESFVPIRIAQVRNLAQRKSVAIGTLAKQPCPPCPAELARREAWDQLWERRENDFRRNLFQADRHGIIDE